MKVKTPTSLVGRFAVRAPQSDRWAHEAWPRGVAEEAEIVETYREKKPGERESTLWLSIVDPEGKTGRVRFTDVAIRLSSPLYELARAASGTPAALKDEHDRLVKFAVQRGMRTDWHEPDEQGVTARVTGKRFDNAGVADELEVTLLDVTGGERWPIHKINLATLCALAARP